MKESTAAHFLIIPFIWARVYPLNTTHVSGNQSMMGAVQQTKISHMQLFEQTDMQLTAHYPSMSYEAGKKCEYTGELSWKKDERSGVVNEGFHLEMEQMWSLQNDAENQGGPGKLLEICVVLLFFKWTRSSDKFSKILCKTHSHRHSCVSLQHPFSGEYTIHAVICLLFYLFILLFFSSTLLLSDRLASVLLCPKGDTELQFLLLRGPWAVFMSLPYHTQFVLCPGIEPKVAPIIYLFTL